MDKGEYFSEQEIKDYFTRFLEVLDMGDAEYQQAIEGKERIVRFNEEKCLLKRLREYVNEHLRYITRHKDIPHFCKWRVPMFSSGGYLPPR